MLLLTRYGPAQHRRIFSSHGVRVCSGEASSYIDHFHTAFELMSSDDDIHDLKLETDDDCEPKKPPDVLIYRLLHRVLAARADPFRCCVGCTLHVCTLHAS